MQAKDTSSPVLVMGATEHGSLGIIRSLGSLGVTVYALEKSPAGPAAYSAFCRKVFEWDFVGNSDDATIAKLREVANRIGSRSILIPTWDEQTSLIDHNYDALKEFFIIPKRPADLVDALTNKVELRNLACSHGVPTPGIDVPASVADVKRLSETLVFPVMLKRIYGNQRRAGAPGATIVRNKDELLRRFNEMCEPSFANVMIQEYIPSPDTAAWLFNGYFDENSNCLVGFTGHKIRQTPIHSGMTTLGICRYNRDVDDISRQFLKSVGYTGMVDIDYLYDARDNTYKMLDVNPRIGASFRLFVDQDGLDVVRAMYLNVTGQPIPSWTFPEGRKWLNERDFTSAYLQFREGTLSLSEWRTSLRGVSEFGYFAWNDLRPVFRVLPYLMKRSSKYKPPTHFDPKAPESRRAAA